MRVEQHATLQLPEFVEFFNESWSFVVKGEVVCRRMIVGLRGVVVSQVSLVLSDSLLAAHNSKGKGLFAVVSPESAQPVRQARGRRAMEFERGSACVTTDN